MRRENHFPQLISGAIYCISLTLFISALSPKSIDQESTMLIFPNSGLNAKCFSVKLTGQQISTPSILYTASFKRGGIRSQLMDAKTNTIFGMGVSLYPRDY